MRLQAFLVTVIMLATFFGCSEGPLAAAPRTTDEVMAERRMVCEQAADVWSMIGQGSLEDLRDATVQLYQQADTFGTTAQKRYVGSATTGVGTATALSTLAPDKGSATDDRVVVSLVRFEQAMTRLDTDCRQVGISVVPAQDVPSV